ncbi:MAG: glycosyltransferase family 4 protein [Leptolyngbyaceae cyanobacterium SL_1_1]|nr:glycosyltransferase family 4 protein [Leptolyngbyaceae cyanobacterium RM1_1_2]NJO09924.1 glycosyltransferase family 4 protein [Leptolyngbyaceae cyanobacterium SL_1_1]
MRILYDGLVYKLQTQGGISRYFGNLISSLPEEFSPIITGYRSKKIRYPSHLNLKKHLYPFAGLAPKRLSEPLGRYFFEAVTAIDNFDLMHPTYYWLHTGQDLKSYSKPVVVTFHDMTHEIFAQQMDSTGQTSRVKHRAAQAADVIICISENTKKDVLERYSISEDKVKVIYHATDLDINMSYGSETVPTCPYFLYVGSRNSHYKNFEILLKAFSKVLSINPDVTLCVVGLELNQDEQVMANSFKISHAIQLYSSVDDHHLAKLYRCSTAFVYPSLYEGFGIPLLEAMACGTPVVASKASCFPEIVDDAGLLFDPNSVADLADILISMLDGSIERDRLIQKGCQRSKLFSWERTVEETCKLYKLL